MVAALPLRMIGCVALLSLLATALPANDFHERMAAWQNGSRQMTASQAMAQETYLQNPVTDPAALPPAEVMRAPAQGSNQRSVQNYGPPMHEPIAPGTPFASYGCDSCGISGGTGCGLLCGGGCSYLNGAGCDGCSGVCSGYGPNCAGCGPNCGSDCCSGYCVPLWWARLDVLLYWRQGRDYPPLVTTDSSNEDSDVAGILPDATILYGGGRETSQLQAGLRIDFGTWLDPSQCVGIGNRFFFLGKDVSEFNRTSDGTPVLAIPFFNDDIVDNDALLVAFPDLREGSIRITDSNEVFGNDVYAKILFCRTNCGRIDFITGYHFSRVNDFFRLRARAAVTEVGGDIPLGTTTSVTDNFDSRNEFHGGILGMSIEHNYCCWTVRSQLQIALGNMHQVARADGSTTIAVPGEEPTTTAGGLFTTDTNIGQISQNEFCVVPEANVTLAYRVNPCLDLSFGYTFMYWSDVARAGRSIDDTIGRDDGATRPVLAFNQTDFWIQGLNFGATYQF